MGLGDNLMATGMARGAAARGRRVAFGNGDQIIWDHNSEQIFRGNPNIAPLGSEGAKDLEWVPFYRGNRGYNKDLGRRWKWNMDFRPIPGEVYFTQAELDFAGDHGRGFVVIEPNVPEWKMSAPNKAWPHWEKLARYLMKGGYDVRQFVPGRVPTVLRAAKHIKTPTFRHALALLRNAALYIGPEGGLHHGAAAVGIPAVVLFGGWIPPQVTGYDTHTNLTGGATHFCGSFQRCPHCRATMARITPDLVEAEALKYLRVNEPIPVHVLGGI